MWQIVDNKVCVEYFWLVSYSGDVPCEPPTEVPIRCSLNKYCNCDRNQSLTAPFTSVFKENLQLFKFILTGSETWKQENRFGLARHGASVLSDTLLIYLIQISLVSKTYFYFYDSFWNFENNSNYTCVRIFFGSICIIGKILRETDNPKFMLHTMLLKYNALIYTYSQFIMLIIIGYY